MDWFLYDNGLRHERVKSCQVFSLKERETFCGVTFKIYSSIEG